jgi:hypothetical protein
MKKEAELPCKTHFKDPIAIKEKKDGKYPWTYDAPHYDKRSSHYMNAGDNYGVGHKQPVGHLGNPKEKAPTLPSGRPETLKIYEDR